MTAKSDALQTIIDVHAHVCPDHFIETPELKNNKKMPCMCFSKPGEADLMIEGKSFRKLDARSWDVARRLDDMDSDGITMQALSPMPELLSYWFNTADGEQICDFMNGIIAGMIAAAPSRFKGLGMVPLQDIPAAIASLRRARDKFGLSGVQIGTHINGVMLGDPRLDPFWEAASGLGMAIFVHPLHPLTARSLDVGSVFHPLVGFPVDTAIAGGSLLINGVLDRFPALRLGLSHGGGALAPVIHRLDQAWNSMAAFRATLTRKPSEAARALFYDTNVYDQQFLAYLATHIAPGKIFLGTDYPYEIMQTAPRDYLTGVPISGAALASLAHGAAREFLGIS